MKLKKIFLFAGEPSGDAYGARLIPLLRAQNPQTKIYGVGGPKMRSAGLESILDMEKFQVMGFIDVALAAPKLFRNFSLIRKLLLKDQPDIAIFIDYPGFNLAMAKKLSKQGFRGKICQYVSPSVWAWGKGRISKMEKHLDHLFVILPFEAHLFNKDKLPVTYVGHPVAQALSELSVQPLDVAGSSKVIALFPGSRKRELYNNFPQHLRAARKLLEHDPNLIFAVSIAEPSFSPLLESMLKQEGFPSKEKFLFVDSSQNHPLMKRAHMAIAKSGTCNLELALFQVPTVVTYGIRPLDLFIAQHIARVRLPYYCLVNIIAGEKVFPELIGPQLTDERLLSEALSLLQSDDARHTCIQKCTRIATLLGEKQPEEEIISTLKTLI